MIASLLLAAAAAAAPALPADETPVECAGCAEWNRPQVPFRIHGNTWYVGVHGLAAVLVDSGDGLVLLDGDLPQSAELVAGNIAALGFDIHDVRWILNSHAHYDHAGGIAALQRMSGARVAASPAGARALRAGTVAADDPQAGYGEAMRFPPVARVLSVRDGGSIRLGDLVVTAHLTPGHTPGATTWTWRSCEADQCMDVVYADSMTPVSAPGFRFSDPAREPTTAARLQASLDVLRGLPCDVLVPLHPGLPEDAGPRNNPFVGDGLCRDYADRMRQRLDARLAEERATAP